MLKVLQKYYDLRRVKYFICVIRWRPLRGLARPAQRFTELLTPPNPTPPNTHHRPTRPIQKRDKNHMDFETIFAPILEPIWVHFESLGVPMAPLFDPKIVSC